MNVDKIMSKLTLYILVLIPSIALASDMGPPEVVFFVLLFISFFGGGLFYLIVGFIFSVIARKIGNTNICKIPLVFGLITIIHILRAGSDSYVVSLVLGVGLSSVLYFKVLVSERFKSTF